MNITGRIHEILPVMQVSETFKRRSFVVETVENPMYPQYISFETVQDRTSLLDTLKVGDQVQVDFNLRGREWTSPQGEKKYFNTLEAWRVGKPDANGSSPSVANKQESLQTTPQGDDLPW